MQLTAENTYVDLIGNKIADYIMSPLMTLFLMAKIDMIDRNVVPLVEILVEPWHLCHIQGEQTKMCERKSELIKN